jgi:hypothetical protein
MAIIRGFIGFLVRAYNLKAQRNVREIIRPARVTIDIIGFYN